MAKIRTGVPPHAFKDGLSRLVELGRGLLAEFLVLAVAGGLALGFATGTSDERASQPKPSPRPSKAALAPEVKELRRRVQTRDQALIPAAAASDIATNRRGVVLLLTTDQRHEQLIRRLRQKNLPILHADSRYHRIRLAIDRVSRLQGLAQLPGVSRISGQYRPH